MLKTIPFSLAFPLSGPMVLPAPVLLMGNLCHEERFWESHGATPAETTTEKHFRVLLFHLTLFHFFLENSSIVPQI